MVSGQKIMIGVVIGYVLGVVIIGAVWIDDERRTKERIAKGELACEYYRDELICWNPKEEGR